VDGASTVGELLADTRTAPMLQQMMEAMAPAKQEDQKNGEQQKQEDH